MFTDFSGVSDSSRRSTACSPSDVVAAAPEQHCCPTRSWFPSSGLSSGGGFLQKVSDVVASVVGGSSQRWVWGEQLGLGMTGDFALGLKDRNRQSLVSSWIQLSRWSGGVSPTAPPGGVSTEHHTYLKAVLTNIGLCHRILYIHSIGMDCICRCKPHKYKATIKHDFKLCNVKFLSPLWRNYDFPPIINRVRSRV